MIARVALTDVRNHAAAMLAPGPGLVVLTGENGAGKTNVLEAVSLLAPGRGLRRAALSDIARQDGPGGFAIAATLSDGTEIGTGAARAAPERRIVRVNGAGAPVSALAERLTVLWLTPAMDRLFTEPAGERRRFLDRLTLALHPAHGLHATRYEAAMRARNRLLAGDDVPDADWLAALEVQMADHGSAVAAARADTVDLLAGRLAAEPEGPFARATIGIEGQDTPSDADFARELAANRRRDAAAGRALAGPHRADLMVRHAAKDQSAALSSTGEQKALLLGIVLAHAALVADRTGRQPILLLDEVAAHLDPTRRTALFERLRGAGQVWMTGTEPALFSGIAATRYTVAAGRIAEG